VVGGIVKNTFANSKLDDSKSRVLMYDEFVVHDVSQVFVPRRYIYIEYFLLKPFWATGQSGIRGQGSPQFFTCTSAST
jgi:hypothetical protein